MKRLFCFMLITLFVSVAAIAESKVYEYIKRNISIRAEDHEIPAMLSVPKASVKEKFPAVNLYGNGSHRHKTGTAHDDAA